MTISLDNVKTILIVGSNKTRPIPLATSFAVDLLREFYNYNEESKEMFEAVGIDFPGTVPVRIPHHSISHAGLLGTTKRPGETALAHGGILILDEATNFQASALERVRDLVEDPKFPEGPDGLMWPRSFLLIAIEMSCPCGRLDPKIATHGCFCGQDQINRHRGLIGKLDDLFDFDLTIKSRT